MSQNINERSIENKKFFKTNNLNAMDSIGITNNGTKYWGKKREKKKKTPSDFGSFFDNLQISFFFYYL